jgi:hypothetical protein
MEILKLVPAQTVMAYVQHVLQAQQPTVPYAKLERAGWKVGRAWRAVLLDSGAMTMEQILNQLVVPVLAAVMSVPPIPRVLDAEGGSSCSPQIRLLVS